MRTESPDVVAVPAFATTAKIAALAVVFLVGFGCSPPEAADPPRASGPPSAAVSSPPPAVPIEESSPPAVDPVPTAELQEAKPVTVPAAPPVSTPASPAPMPEAELPAQTPPPTTAPPSVEPPGPVASAPETVAPPAAAPPVAVPTAPVPSTAASAPIDSRPASDATGVVDPGGEIAVEATRPGLSRIGAAKCGICHKPQLASWSDSPHGTREPPLDCESCHGAGSEYKSLSVMKDAEKAKAAGLVMPTATFCATCHQEGWSDEMLQKAHAHKEPPKS